MDTEALKQWILAVIEEEFNPRAVELSPRWEGGMLILKPSGDHQSKEVPLEVFFKKLTSMRESLRVLEQKLNNHETLSVTDKASMQAYVTKCYGSLTTFNILFKHDKDRFVGSSSKQESDSSPGNAPVKEKLTMGEARKRLGLREHGE